MIGKLRKPVILKFYLLFQVILLETLIKWSVIMLMV